MEFAGKHEQDEYIFHRIFYHALFSPMYSHTFYEVQHKGTRRGPVQGFIIRRSDKDG